MGKRAPIALVLPMDAKCGAWRAVRPGYSAYVPRVVLMREVVPYASRTWWLNGLCCAALMPWGGTVRPLEKFPHTLTEDPDTFRDFLGECHEIGAPCPSSCPGVFHQLYESPRLQWGTVRLFAERTRGGWEEALQTGDLPGLWRLYDMRKAYLWASTRGLPKVESIRHVRGINETRPGLYVVNLREPSPHLPYPFNCSTRVLATSEELDAYAPPVDKVIGGVVWTDLEPGDMVTRRVQPLSFSKYVASQFWGRWLSSAPLECRTIGGHSWTVPNPVFNPVWATVIISRVRMRCWEAGRGAAHVFCDSVLTRDTLPTGEGLGDWRLEKEYPEGIRVEAAGRYGPLGGRLDKTARTPKGAQ